jgi:IS5 family transposase
MELPRIATKGVKSGDFMKWRKPNKPTSPSAALALRQLLDQHHPLYQLAAAINWQVIEESLGKFYANEIGRPGLPIRLLVGLHYLKHLYHLSDEAVVAGWVENPYWQYFCGEQAFQHRLPCDPTSLVKWRQRVGADGIEQLLKETLDAARRQQVLQEQEIERLNVDTTVQEKAVAFPTDARLYHKARRALVRVARQVGCRLRQNYQRLSKKALWKQSRYASAQQMKRARKETKRLKTYLGRVLRNVERFSGPLREKQAQVLKVARRIFEQERQDTGKVYSLHAPEVECLSKGKAHKRYEFGCKVRVATTNQRNWVVGIDAESGNPYDGAMLKPAIDQVQRLTGVKVKEAFVDKGYRGSDHHPEGVSVYLSGRKNLGRRLKAMLRRRSAIEPVIGHTKHDHGMERNHLLGRAGDRINAMLSGCGWNLRKLWREFVENPRPALTI